jgi:hypothetical protein
VLKGCTSIFVVVFTSNLHCFVAQMTQRRALTRVVRVCLAYEHTFTSLRQTYKAIKSCQRCSLVLAPPSLCVCDMEKFSTGTTTPMTGHDRKRCYSQAFQLAMNVSPSRQSQVPKFMATPFQSAFSTPTWLEGSNKENTTPFEQGKDNTPLTADHARSDFHYPPDLTPFPLEQNEKLSFREHPLRDLTQLSQDAGETPRQAPSLPSGICRRLTLDSDHPANGDVLDFRSSSPGPTISIHEDDYTMSDMHVSTGPSTPSVLNMQDLSLVDHQACPRPRLPIRRNRATIHIAPLGHWTG